VAGMRMSMMSLQMVEPAKAQSSSGSMSRGSALGGGAVNTAVSRAIRSVSGRRSPSLRDKSSGEVVSDVPAIGPKGG
jgi:hypothetical protein